MQLPNSSALNLTRSLVYALSELHSFSSKAGPRFSEKPSCEHPNGAIRVALTGATRGMGHA